MKFKLSNTCKTEKNLNLNSKLNYKTENENRKREKEERPHLDLTWPSSPLVAQQHRPNTSPVPLR
jgi:hypothetical protein